MPKIHTSYIICAVQRSGSFLLCEALKNTGLAGFPREYFLYHPGGSNWEDGSWAIAAHNIEPLKVIYEELIEAYKETGLRVLDFFGCGVSK